MEIRAAMSTEASRASVPVVLVLVGLPGKSDDDDDDDDDDELQAQF